MSISFFFAFLMGIGSITSQDLIPYLAVGRYGYADTNGKIIIQPTYDEVSLFGHYELFSLLFEEKPKPEYKKYFPKNVASVYKDSLWQLIDQEGKSILMEGSTSRPYFALINFSNYYRYGLGDQNPKYLIIRSNNAWGIWDTATAMTDGLIYSHDYNNLHDYNEQNVNGNISLGNDSDSTRSQFYRVGYIDDLRPGRYGHRGPSSRQIPECDCVKARRLDGKIDLIASYGAVLVRSVEDNDIQLATQCRKQSNPPNPSSYSESEAKPRAKKNLSYNFENLEQDANRLQQLDFSYVVDSLGNRIGEKYDEVKLFLISNKFFGAGLNDGKVEIFNDRGDILYRTDATKISKSITGNLLWPSNAVFIKGNKEKILIDATGNEIFPPGTYEEILSIDQYTYVAFLSKESCYPLHLYDNNWNRIHNDEIHGVYRTGTILTLKLKDENGQFYFRPYAPPRQINLDVVKFDSIAIFGQRYSKGKKLMTRMEEVEKHPVGYIKTDYDVDVYKYFLSSLKKRPPRQFEYPMVLYSNTTDGQRIIIANGNNIKIDTVIQNLQQIETYGDYAIALIDGHNLKLNLNRTIRSLLKTYYTGSNKDRYGGLYCVREGEEIQLWSANKELILSRPYVDSNSRISVQYLIDDRYFVKVNDTEGYILNYKGEILKAIEVMDEKWQKRSRKTLEKPLFVDPDLHYEAVELIDDRLLKVNTINPYVIDLETMFVYRD